MTTRAGQLAILAGLLLTAPVAAEPPEPPPEEPHSCCSVAAEVGFLKPTLHNGLTGPVLLGDGTTVAVQPPGAPLGDTVAPRLELAFHLPPDTDFVATYRFLAADGRTVLIDPVIGAGVVRSRLNLNVVDLDLACLGCGPWPMLDLRWRIGARVSDLFFDSGASGSLGTEGDSGHFYGIGPHLGLDLWQKLPISGLSLYGRFDTAAQFASVRQSFGATSFAVAAPVSGEVNSDTAQYSPLVFQGSAGIDYAPDWFGSHLHLSAGYEYEHWWEVVHIHESRAALTTNGVFVRAEWAF